MQAIASQSPSKVTIRIMSDGKLTLVESLEIVPRSNIQGTTCHNHRRIFGIFGARYGAERVLVGGIVEQVFNASNDCVIIVCTETVSEFSINCYFGTRLKSQA